MFLVLRQTEDREAAEGWALALAATGIPCRLHTRTGQSYILVNEADIGRAQTELEDYDREEAARPPPPPPAPNYGWTYGGLMLAVSLISLYWLTTIPSATDWGEIGAARSGSIVRGEWWRAVTALTLHADAGHVLGNAVSSLVFGTLLFSIVGPGAGVAGMLLAGMAGNLVNAWTQHAGHVSVGASTAIFASIGILSGIQFSRRWRIRLPRRRPWLPIAAGIALLAMLGTGGERTDVWAHLWGLTCGIPVGAIFAFASESPPPMQVQTVLLLGTILAVLASWTLALG